ncbi:FAD-binding domain-containing protein [Daedaleopsis nitida]|nr:FAD-binding domain-containing protein [Daedaleopsis nitida]
MRPITVLSLLLLCGLRPLKAFTATTSQCRCLFGDPCWPSEAEFEALAAQVSQPLVHPIPPASPCYTSPTSPECATVGSTWIDGIWRADQAGAMQSTNFETFIFPNGTIDACYLNAALGTPCNQGSVSAIGVDARTVEDIQAAVNFAVTHNLRLAVKNTGHDYFGRSNARGSFMLWTHHLKNITVHPTFAPTGAPSTSEVYDFALTIGSGVQWHEAYDAANEAGRILVGGASAGGSVGASGGWIQGGGHSALSPSYGLGVDNVLEMTVITSSGSFLTANAYHNSDLFWALRGGGGGTFGVVTSVTYRTRPTVPVIAAFLDITQNGSQLNAGMSKVFAELVRITPELTDAGWGGYVSFTPSNDSVNLNLATIVPNVSWEQANATMQPYLDFVTEVVANSTTTGNASEILTLTAALTTPFDSWYDWYKALYSNPDGAVGFNVELGTWLIPRDAIENNMEQVVDTLSAVPGLGYYLVCGGETTKIDPDSAAVNPAWRKAVVHVVGATVWAEGATAGTINQLREGLKTQTAKLRALAPDSGAYFNEASLYEPDFRQSFFGSHYEKLRKIKAKYDPIDLFVVVEGVGSEEWSKDLNCRL